MAKEKEETAQGRFELRGYRGTGKNRKTVSQVRTPSLTSLVGFISTAIEVGEAQYFWLKDHEAK